MKKNLISILVFVMIMPLMVNAKEYCKVVSGNGKDIGSEIACGTEHFYVIENNNNKVRMLSKYNLYTGYIIDRIDINKSEGDARSNYEYCNDIARERGVSAKHYDGYFSEPNYANEDEYCYLESKIETEKIVQNEEAIGAHVDKDGNYLYPQIGDNYLNNQSDTISDAKTIDNSITYSDTNYKDFVIELNNNTVLGKNLLSYKNNLAEMGIEVSNIDILSISELDNIINKTTNKRLPLVEWGSNVRDLDVTFGAGGSVKYNLLGTFGDIKDYVPEKYSWLYSTTYWNKTIFYTYKPNLSFGYNTYGEYFHVFTGSMGKICAAGFPFCIPTTALGCGIRPVIEIENNELVYTIKTETDGNGTIDVVENSLGGEIIQFRVSINKGYKFGSIIITTDSGEKVEFSEGEIIKNDDGTFSIDKNKFTMPFESITIQAKFESENILKNPETGDKLLFMILILVASIGIGTLIYIKKYDS